MSAGFLGALAGVGPGVTEGLNAKENRAASKSERVINEAVEARAAESHQWNKDYATIFEQRSLVDDPETWLANQQLEAGAIPLDGPPELPSRRERYQQWYDQASKLSFLTGGIEGRQAFLETEDAISKEQILGYGLQAVSALNEGRVADAVKAGNTALGVTPFDTGLSFEAIDGKIHMVGEDGVPGKALSTQELMAFVENNLKTKDNYLAWKAQYEKERATRVAEGQTDRSLDLQERGVIVDEDAQAESERAALVEESQKDRSLDQEDERIGIADRNAAVQEGYLDIAWEKLPSEISKTGAEIRKLLMDADSAWQRALKAGEDSNGLSNSELLKIYNDIPEIIQKAQIDPGMEWIKPLMQQPGMMMMMQSGMMDIMVENFETGANYADAIGLATLAYSEAAGVPIPENAPMPTGIGITEDGRHYADYGDKRLYVPSHMYQALDLLGGGEQE